MLGTLTDFIPKELAFSVIAYAAASYFVTSDQIAVRIAKADHLPACEVSAVDLIEQASRAEADALPGPEQLLADQEGAQALIDLLKRYPNYRELDILMGGVFSDAERKLARMRRQAIDAYNQSKRQLEARAQARIDAVPDMCGCMARSSYEENRTEWAIFTGALGLVVPEPVKAYGDEMRRYGAACLARGDV